MQNDNVEKLKMMSKDVLSENIEKIASIFPDALVEASDGKKIDFDILKQELSKDIVDGVRERYHLNFPGKKEAIVEANRPITKTLRPLKEKSVDFDNTKNIYIEGDNLEALKILQESYFNKIKCIYIDPPYNTGNDFVYNDDFSKSTKEEMKAQGVMDENGNVLTSKNINNDSNGRYHSDWLKMMYPRLKLARNLLSDDGAVFISIDDNEVANARKICDEIFGENNYVSCLAVENNPKGRKNGKFFAINHESCLVYVKNYNKNEGFKDIVPKEKMLQDSKGFYTSGQRVLVGNCSNKIASDVNSDKYYFVYYKENQQLEIRKTIDDKLIDYKLYISKDDAGNIIENTYTSNKLLELYNCNNLIFKEDTIYEKDRNINKQQKTLICSSDNYDLKTESANFLYNDFDLKKMFNMPKNVDYIRMLLKLNVENKDIVLDFFSGSATTAHAVMKLNAEDGGNRQFILVQLPEATEENSEAYKAGYKNICEIGEERIKRASKKILEENKKENNIIDVLEDKEERKLDTGFRVFRIDESNMKDVFYEPDKIQQGQIDSFITNIKEDRTKEDLLIQVMLDMGLTLDLKIEEKKIEEKTIFIVSDKELVACFDEKIDKKLIDEIIKIKPIKVVLRESGFEKDEDKINYIQSLKNAIKEIDIRII